MIVIGVNILLFTLVKAQGDQLCEFVLRSGWIPACAGMTEESSPPEHFIYPQNNMKVFHKMLKSIVRLVSLNKFRYCRIDFSRQHDTIEHE